MEGKFRAHVRTVHGRGIQNQLSAGGFTAQNRINYKTGADMSRIGDFEFGSNNELKKYTGNDETVVVPDCTKTIGMCAFKNCQDIEKIILADGIINIEYGAFDDC